MTGVQTCALPICFTGTEVDYAVEVCNAVLDIMQPTPDRPMIINLPFANVNKIPNFLEPDEIVPVRVYLIVASPFVNVSGLRIDEAATAADYLQDFDTINAQMTASVQEKLEHIQTEMAKPKDR